MILLSGAIFCAGHFVERPANKSQVEISGFGSSEKGKALLREWKLPETLRGVGAIALGYPAQEAGQPAARKQNYIVRI